MAACLFLPLSGKEKVEVKKEKNKILIPLSRPFLIKRPFPFKSIHTGKTLTGSDAKLKKIKKEKGKDESTNRKNRDRKKQVQNRLLQNRK
jgi:hypothetical protein